MYPKKVTYLGGQIGNQTWKFGRHWVKTSRIGKSTRRKVEICFGSVLFSLDEWILCSAKYLSDGQVKWKKRFFRGESECEFDMRKSNRASHHSSCYRRVQKSTLTSCDKFLPFDWNKEGTFTRRHGKNYGNNSWLKYYIIVRFWAFLPIFPEKVAAKLKLLVNND